MPYLRRGDTTLSRVVFPRVRGRLLALLLCLGGVPFAQAAQPPGSVITNTAQAAFATGTRTGLSTDSNAVDLVVVPVRTTATVSFMRHRPGVRTALSVPVAGTEYSTSGDPVGPYAAVPGPAPLTGAPIDLSRPVPLETAAVFSQGEPVFLHLVDPDRNLDANAADAIILSVENPARGDRELLKVYETGPGTGEFLGYIQSRGDAAGQAKDGTLSVRQDDIVTVSYVDAEDPADRAEADARFDPVGRVFDSRTGEPVTGVTVRLVDHLTGAPATVTGNDGISPYPAAVTTGTPLVDAAGTTYDFGPGGYRFPHVPDGQYRLVVEVPAGYRAPTRFDDGALQGLPGAPFALATPGSRGEPFFPGEAPLLIDIPVDKVRSDLFVSKTADRTSVAVGDFVPYEIRVENAASDDASDLTVTDRLPAGFRYRTGSTLVDGAAAPDPAVSADGRTLVFTRAALAAGSSLTIRYVTAVLPGAAVGDAVNRVSAAWAGQASNEATALVSVRRDLFGDTATVVGRVRSFDCDASPDSARGVPDVRVYLESGAFAVTDADGRYHLAGLAPGAHLVQLDPASLPAGFVPGDCGGDTLLAEHPWSRLIDVQGGTLWRSDFRLRRVPPTEGVVELSLDTELQRDRITGRVRLAGEEVPLRALRLTVMLPEGTGYEPGSSRLGARRLPDPVADQGALVYRLDELAAGTADTLHFAARVEAPLQRADLVCRALLVCDTPAAANVRSEVVTTSIGLVPEVVREQQPEMVLRPRFASLSAELGPADVAGIDSLLAGLAGLDIVALKVVGHTDSQRIRPGSHPVYTDNLALSLARAAAVGRLVSERLALSEAQLSIYGMGAREPVADNATAEGRARNRRVTLQVWTAKTVHRLPELTLRDHERTRLPVRGLRPGESWSRPVTAAADTLAMPVYDAAWLAAAPVGERILWPPRGHLPHLPAIKLAVQHAAADSVQLRLNGAPAGHRNFAGRVTDPDGRQAVSTWAGLDLVPGDNVVGVEITDPQGRLVRRLERQVHYSGPPAYAEVLPEASVLVADGSTRPVIAVRLTDSMGYPARREVIGRYSVASPHEAWRAKGDSDRETITELQEKVPTYTIGADGVALLPLAPTTTSGEALLQLELTGHAEELRVWLRPAPRDWVLAGVVEGTVGYNTVAGNLETLAASDRSEEFYSDGRLAFFAKGRLKGAWLLTLAYDSREPDADPNDGLFGVVDPDAYYTVYGDAVVQRHDAASRDRLYVRLEREQFYALYGDHETGLTMTELARYSRAQTGLRASRRGDKVGFDVFASGNRQNFRRDEIRGDGTSGLYRLSSTRILPRSARISLQTRERYRNEVVITERQLTRGVDFTLDELDGTLFFKQPVPSQDENFNPVWIVALYETESGSGDEVTAGGRGSWRPGGGGLELGLTGVREGTQGGGGDVLAGADTRWDLTRALRLEAEYAATDTRTAGRRAAWRGELDKRAGTILGRLYYRQQEAGFGLGQQNIGEAGTRKYGLDLRWHEHAQWRADGVFFGQDDLVGGRTRRFGELKVNHDRGPVTAGVGLRAANDESGDGSLQQSRQLTADASLKVLRNRGRLRLAREQDLTGRDDMADFPTRTSLGAEYEVMRNQKVFLARELVDGGGPADHRTRLGVEAVPWTGGRVVSSAERRSRESERRVFANLGLQQSLRLNRAWHLDASLDHGLSTDAVPDSLGTTAPAGDVDFTAGSLGATWRSGPWLVDQRLEYRTSGTAEKWGLAGGVHVEPGGDLGLLASVRFVRTDYRAAGHQSLGDVSLGLAWRPDDSPWTILQRLSWRGEDKSGVPAALSNWRVVNNLNVARMLGGRDQVSALLGMRFNRDTIAGRRYYGVSDQLGLEWRHFWGRRWDAGLRGSSRHAWREGVVDWSAGVSCGYKLLEDIWLSLGYNVAGYRDRDFSVNDSTAQGPYLRFRVRFNQEVTRAALR